MRAIMTMADLWRPCVKMRSLLYDLSTVVGGSVLIALSAQFTVRLPFSPVPITGQTFAVLLLAALLGPARGVLCVLTYLAEGLLGLPVFAGAGSGPAWLLGATGGYLVGSRRWGGTGVFVLPLPPCSSAIRLYTPVGLPGWLA